MLNQKKIDIVNNQTEQLRKSCEKMIIELKNNDFESKYNIMKELAKLINDNKRTIDMNIDDIKLINELDITVNKVISNGSYLEEYLTESICYRVAHYNNIMVKYNELNKNIKKLNNYENNIFSEILIRINFLAKKCDIVKEETDEKQLIRGYYNTIKLDIDMSIIKKYFDKTYNYDCKILVKTWISNSGSIINTILHLYAHDYHDFKTIIIYPTENSYRFKINQKRIFFQDNELRDLLLEINKMAKEYVMSNISKTIN